MATVKDLIAMLQEEHDPNEPIIFQYFVSDYTSYDEYDFAKIADYLMNNSQFADDASELFISWMSEANDILSSELEDCIHCDGDGFDKQANDCDYCNGTGKNND